MGSTKKSKACCACTNGKRRCDRAQPVCGRCDEKDTECRYPPTRRRKHHLQGIQGHVLNESPGGPCDGTQDAQEVAALDSGVSDDVFDLQHWAGPVVDWNDLLPLQPQLEYLDADASRKLVSFDAGELANNPGPLTSSWFCHPGSWAISHCPTTTPSFSSAVFNSYWRTLESWLTQWVTEGQNPFIHRQLYADSGLPRSMRDAYASIAVHDTKGPRNDTLVYQIVEANAASLVSSQDACEASPVLDTRQHLARTQALFIYLTLLLNSPSITARSQAERNVPVFQTWVQQLWESASQDPDLSDSSTGGNAQIDAVADAVFDGDPAPRLWRAWVLAESIRRTWILGTMTVGVYLTQKQGWCECKGGAKFTMGSGIWAAESAVSWAQAVRNQDPMFSLSLECGRLFTSARAAAVDEFARHQLAAMYGLERVESWAARTAGDNGMVKVVY
ncbi:hypothetical protein G7Z17_g2281 [Cylindrodendrum hubeiense]|uniref:Zn(2)-C6 fungal-type domain-containing protein n=1 Tax=Cylindrodendrum hubeiense TaxID=595255 RepID=A0A9P5LKH4_9HYPO|nr:hypothetical protein G7Z17_g2281 [Cylindrodendrum hubeiense]